MYKPCLFYLNDQKKSHFTVYYASKLKFNVKSFDFDTLMIKMIFAFFNHLFFLIYITWFLNFLNTVLGDLGYNLPKMKGLLALARNT